MWLALVNGILGLFNPAARRATGRRPGAAGGVVAALGDRERAAARVDQVLGVIIIALGFLEAVSVSFVDLGQSA